MMLSDALFFSYRGAAMGPQGTNFLPHSSSNLPNVDFGVLTHIFKLIELFSSSGYLFCYLQRGSGVGDLKKMKKLCSKCICIKIVTL